MSTLGHMTLSSLVAARPARAEVLDGFGIDYCCQGASTLADAVREARVPAADVEAALIAAPGAPDGDGAGGDLPQRSLSALVGHIMARYHAPLAQQADDVERRLRDLAVHEAHVRNELVELLLEFLRLRSELSAHVEQQELETFPELLNFEVAVSSGRPVAGAVRQAHLLRRAIRQQHDACESIREMRRLTDNFTPAPGATDRVESAYGALRRFAADVLYHQHLENYLVFNRGLELCQKFAEPAPSRPIRQTSGRVAIDLM